MNLENQIFKSVFDMTSVLDTTRIKMFIWSLDGDYDDASFDNLNCVLKANGIDTCDIPKISRWKNIHDRNMTINFMIYNLVDNATQVKFGMPFEPEIGMLWLIEHHHEVNIKDKRTFTQQRHISRVLKDIEITPNQLKDINKVVFEYNSYFYDEITGLVTQDDLKQLHDLLESTVPMGTRIQLSHGHGYKDKSEPFPRVVAQIGGFTIATPPFGIKGIWPQHYVIAYNDIPISKYLKVWIRNYDDNECRALSYALSNPDFAHVTAKVVISSKVTNMDDYNINDLPNIILNLPQIRVMIRDVINTSDYLYITNHLILCGQRELIHRHIRDNRIAIRPTPKWPHCIEDYINIQLPQLGNWNIQHNIWNYMNFSLTEADMKQFNHKSFMQWLTPNFNPKDLIQIRFLLMASKVHVNDCTMITYRCVKFFIQLYIMGGIGEDVATAKPIKLGFIRQLELFSDRDIQTIMTYLHIPIRDDKGRYMTYEDLKIILQRGYKYPLPYIANADKMNLWATLTPNGMAMYYNTRHCDDVAGYYMFGPDSRDKITFDMSDYN